MTLQVPLPGITAAEFIVSSVPWLTSSVTTTGANDITRLDFPGVTKFVKVRNTDASNSIFVGFGLGVTGSYKYEVTKGTETDFLIRCKALYLAGSGSAVKFSVIAGLTGVDRRFIPDTYTGTQI